MRLFQQGEFHIDQNTTPEMLRKKRDRIEAMMPRFGQAKYIGEGIGQLLYGIGSGRSDQALDTFEGEENAKATDVLSRTIDIFNRPRDGGGPMSILGMRQPSQPGPNQGIADDAMAAVGRAPLGGGGADAASIRAGLIDRGLPAHVADGFVMNFQDESGMNPGINERNPTVPGSRGGFGLAQWTGPRRRELEAFAQQRGVPVSDANLQMDFLMTELGGSESRAAQSILASQGSGQAGAAIVNQFLRPAEQHRSSREARYLGGNGAPPTMSAQNNPAQPAQQPAGGSNMAMLMEVAANPWYTIEQRQIINGMIAQEQQRADPSYQMGLERQRLELDRLRSGGGANMPSGFASLDMQAQAGGLVPGTPEYQSYMRNGGGDPATFRALDMQAQAAGFTPGTAEYATFMGTRGAGDQAGARVRAENTADAETAAAAEAARTGGAALGKSTVEAGMSAWEGFGKLQTSLGNIDEAIAAIDGGAKSGLVYSMLPSVTQASASLENAMQRMGLDVIGSVTFGALSEGEMRLAMSTAVPQNLSPPDLRAWLVRRRDAQAKAAVMLGDAAQYLTTPGNTINGWIARNQATRAAAQGQTPPPTAATSQTPPPVAAQSAPPPTAAQGQTRPPMDFSQMSAADLGNVDINSLTEAEMSAMMKRFDEVAP